MANVQITVNVASIGSYSEDGFAQTLTRAFLGTGEAKYSPISVPANGIVDGTTLIFTLPKGTGTAKMALWLDGGEEHYTVANMTEITVAGGRSIFKIHDARFWNGNIDLTQDNTISVSCVPACTGVTAAANHVPANTAVFTLLGPTFSTNVFNAIAGRPADSITAAETVVNALPYKFTLLSDAKPHTEYLMLQAYDQDGTALSTTENITVSLLQGSCTTADFAFPVVYSFKHYYKNSTLIGSEAVKFRRFSAAAPKPMLSAPQNVTADGTTVSWDEVENATSYEIFADGKSIGTIDGEVNN